MKVLSPVEEVVRDAPQFPQELDHDGSLGYRVSAIKINFDENEDRLFCDADNAMIRLRELRSGGKAFSNYKSSSAMGIVSQFEEAVQVGDSDPRCRFIHIDSDHSRSRLNTTREMLFIVFTYLDVIPTFLDFLSPFGQQEHPEDPFYSSFEERTRLDSTERGRKISELGWSGHDISVCYNIRSIERSDKQDWPWSIRQCAIHHLFDIQSGRSTWVVVKGNNLMETRLQSATGERGPPATRNYQTLDRAFAATLATHVMFCELSTESGHCYLKYLEHCVQNLTRSTTSTKTDIPDDTQPNDPESFDAPRRQDTQRSYQTQNSWLDSVRSPFLSRRNTTVSMPSVPEKEVSSPLQTFTNIHGNSQPLPPGTFMEPFPSCEAPPYPTDEYGQRVYTFRDLQDIQEFEEKTSEAQLVLNLNSNIISQLRHYYVGIMQYDDMPLLLKHSCHKDLIRFERRIETIGNCIKLLVLRAEALKQLLADRKTLVHGHLEFKTVRANQRIAEQSRRSTQKMEVMTHDMSDVAYKTKTETVSMKIITLVTLFFLPGTFVSTLMSTDIVHWNSKNNDRIYQSSALRVYFAISLPFMLATFIVWYAFHYLEKRKDRQRRDKLEEERGQA